MVSTTNHVAEQTSKEWLIDSGAAINCGPNGHGVKNSTIPEKKFVQVGSRDNLPVKQVGGI